MHLVLLSGGSGKRLWPLSNEARSKQFLRLLPSDDGRKESMVQRVYRQIRKAGIDAPIIVTTSEIQVSPIRSQLGDDVEVVAEPVRRDTYPAIVLAAYYLKYKKQCDRDEIVIVLPVDPYAELGYFEALNKMGRNVEKGISDLVLMGIQPTYPSEKYGYILPGGFASEDSRFVSRFVEKPTESQAAKLISEGAVWNGGVFAFKLGYLLDIAYHNGNFNSYEDVYNHYGDLPKISFDYQVVEKASSISMISYHGIWKDLGTWNTLTEEVKENQRLVITGEGTENTQVINELDMPLLVLGAKDMVIVSSPDGILVADKRKSSFMKPYVEKFEKRPMYEERSWGTYKVLDYNIHEDNMKSLTKHLHISAGQKISYQFHHYRDEIWTIISGTAILLLDGHQRNVTQGDVAYITAGMKHSIKAVTDLHIVEVQIGTDLAEDDIERIAFDW